MAATMRSAVGRLSKFYCRYRPGICIIPIRNSSQSAAELEDVVQYPEIREKYPPGRWSSDISPGWAWHYYNQGQGLFELSDVRERLEEISGQKNKTLHIVKNWDRIPRTLQYKQYITKTHIVQGLPDIYGDVIVDELFDRVAPMVKDLILQENLQRHNRITSAKLPFNERPWHKTGKLLERIVELVLTVCSNENEHMLRSQVDRNVRVEAFWRVGGYDRKDLWQSRLWMQAKDTAALQIRTEQPLPEFVPMDDKLCTQGEYPNFNYSPSTLRQEIVRERPITISGHWIGDPCEFTHFTAQVPGKTYMQLLKNNGHRSDLIDETWTQCGLTSSFSSCCAQAHNQGFNVYLDVSAPFTTQSLVCHGNDFQFFAYQLNTLHMWLLPEANTHNNVLWVGKKQKLFESVENGEVQGFNNEILRHLLKIIVLKSVDRSSELRPHLSLEEAPVTKRQFINNKDEPVLPVKKIERFQYPRNAVYF